MLNRRRFLSIAAVAALTPAAMRAAPLYVETGIALGARVTLRLAHPDAAAISARAMTEIRRLEGIFSLYQPQSDLVRLNRDGQLQNPPFELLDCLSVADAVHRASDGRFDPTVQPLWLAHAQAAENRQALDERGRAEALALTGWDKVTLDATRIAMRPGMALTLNGIAQGYIADRVARLLADEGLSDVLIDSGEMRALGGRPDGTAWPVKLASGGQVGLRSRALATSSPLGMTFANDGRTGHILDPRSGHPVPARWSSISISADSAALADALSTAACMASDREQIDALCAGFAQTRIEAAVPV